MWGGMWPRLGSHMLPHTAAHQDREGRCLGAFAPLRLLSEDSGTPARLTALQPVSVCTLCSVSYLRVTGHCEISQSYVALGYWDDWLTGVCLLYVWGCGRKCVVFVGHTLSFDDVCRQQHGAAGPTPPSLGCA